MASFAAAVSGSDPVAGVLEGPADPLFEGVIGAAGAATAPAARDAPQYLQNRLSASMVKWHLGQFMARDCNPCEGAGPNK
ncbi:MAG: hypothetical protein AMXMBFR20_20430 [Planctomycetia bacterium]